ncbi:MAG: hypothetical protein J7507_01765 [Pseudoxanthomonas sp.]|nr:hypothetical protein [Pseudoxanthomonas sp.]
MREGIYRKTDAGRDEISNRGRRLSPPLRTVLLMVDGQRSLAQLREVMAGMKAPEDALETLLADGLVELVPSGFDVAGLVGAVAPRPASQPPSVVMAEVPAAAAPAGDGRSAQYLYLYERMSEAVRSHLGLRGYFLQLKVERCNDADGLQALLPELRAALAKAKGESFASVWERALEVPA